MKNIPEIKLGIIAVSRDCFPVTLSEKRRANIVKAYKGDIYECPVTVENESDMMRAVDDVKKSGCNALQHPLRKNHAEVGGSLRIQQIQIFHELLLLVLLGMLGALKQMLQFLSLCFQLLMLDFILDKHC